MRRIFALVMLAVLVGSPGCRKQPEGALNVVVIGSPPTVRDPAAGPLAQSDLVLLSSVAQGLVQFDASGNIVSGLAERWTVSDDGLSYIFRLAASNWPGGGKISAEQVARLLKREIGPRSKNRLKDQFGAVDEIVAMTDRVLEINLSAPRPDLLALLAQPEMAIIRNGEGTGPFTASSAGGGKTRLTREIVSPEDGTPSREEVLLEALPAKQAIASFTRDSSDLVLGGTFADLALARNAQLPRGSLRFDEAFGLFGLVPASSGGPLDKPEVRQLLSEAIDRDSFVAMVGVPGLAARSTLLEPGLDGVPAPAPPSWSLTPHADRMTSLEAQAKLLFKKEPRPSIAIALPPGPGSDLLLALIARDWGALGFRVDRARNGVAADFVLIDEVAPSSSPAWFVRRFRCGVVAVCDPHADLLMDGARQSPVPAQRFALLAEAATRIDSAVLFLPITAPVRWSLVSARIQNFAGNRYARHTLTDLEAKPSSGE
jgi:peptide/nickel transport system substrate-binding protein